MRAHAPLFALVILVACGGRTPLGTRGATATDAGARDGAPDDGASGPTCTWSLTGSPARVSSDPKEVPGDVGLQDAVETTGGALVAWVTPGDLMHPQTAVARLVAFDLVSNGNEHVALRAPSVTAPLFGVSLGNGYGHVAITAWDGKSCVLRPITLDGASNGSLAEVDPRRCGGTIATPAGFDLLLHTGQGFPSPQLFSRRVDEIGVVSPPDALLFQGAPGESVGAARRATLPDGTFVVAAVLEGTQPASARVVARHFDARGVPLAPEQTIATGDDIVETVMSVAAITGGVQIAWLASDGQKSRVYVTPTDRDARPLRAGLVAVSARTFVTSIDLASDLTGGSLLAWTEYGPTPSSATVLALNAAADPRGAPLAIPDPVSGAKYAPAIRVVATGTRGLVLFEARSDNTAHRVYAAPLACAP